MHDMPVRDAAECVSERMKAIGICQYIANQSSARVFLHRIPGYACDCPAVFRVSMLLMPWRLALDNLVLQDRIDR